MIGVAANEVHGVVVELQQKKIIYLGMQHMIVILEEAQMDIRL